MSWPGVSFLLVRSLLPLTAWPECTFLLVPSQEATFSRLLCSGQEAPSSWPGVSFLLPHGQNAPPCTWPGWFFLLAPGQEGFSSYRLARRFLPPSTPGQEGFPPGTWPGGSFLLAHLARRVLPPGQPPSTWPGGSFLLAPGQEVPSS